MRRVRTSRSLASRMIARSLACTLLACILSTTAVADDGRRIRRVEVTGNSRTATTYVQRALGVGPGDPFDPAAVPRLEQRVSNLRLFKSVRVEPVPDGDGAVVLRVTVEERWTLVPIPVVTATRGNVGGGLFVRESNLFGRGKQLGAGGIVSTRGTSASAFYRDPGVLETPLLFGAEFARIDVRRERDTGGGIVYEYQDRRYEYAVALGWQLAEPPDIRAGYFGVLVDATPTAGFAPPPRAPPVRGLSGDIEYRAEDYHLYHVTGFSARARYRQGVSWLASARDLWQVSAAASWSARGFRDHALSITATFDRSRGDPVVDAVRLGGRPGSRGFSFGGLWAETAGTFTAEYQIPFWRPSWGVVTGGAFVDAGLTRWRGVARNYVAPGAGFRVYLRGIALPALGLDVAKATGVGSPVVSFAAGLRY